MTRLLDHLGVALLGHVEFGANLIPDALVPVWKKYASDKRLAPDLLNHARLLMFVNESELRIASDGLGHATLCALGYMFGHAKFDDVPLVLASPRARELLLSRLQGRLRLTVGPREIGKE